jgi:phosphomannomutase
LEAAARAITDAGYRVEYSGRIPTPALAYYAMQNGVAGFMVTGSHIPADRNGLKANRYDGEVLKSDERGIVAAVHKVRDDELKKTAKESRFDEHGMLKPLHRVKLPELNPAAEQLYVERYRAFFSNRPVSSKRIVFFEYSAVGRDLLPEILEGLNIQVIRAGRSDEFVPIDTEAISDKHLEMLREIVIDQSKTQGPIEAIISTDGDSDRPLVVGVNQDASSGSLDLRFFPGDLLGVIVAEYLDADSVSIPISANPAVQEYFYRINGEVTSKTRIGSPFVIQSMQNALKEGKKRVVAWEANGGFLVGSDITLNGGLLKALPTRDALLPILCVLSAAAEKELTLSRLFDRLPEWFGRAGLIDQFPGEISQGMLNYFTFGDEHIKSVDYKQDKILLSNAAQEVVGQWLMDDTWACEACVKKRELESVFTLSRGFEEIRSINTLDGIRCSFKNGEIVHIRPSGNAPQLRIYAYARTQTRADEIVKLGVAESNGILRDLQRLIQSKK